MRGPERLPFCETEAGWSVRKTCAEAAGQGLSSMQQCIRMHMRMYSGAHAHKCTCTHVCKHVHAERDWAS
eukprot:364357-Chlamydomonas_euryale.AAC.8